MTSSAASEGNGAPPRSARASRRRSPRGEGAQLRDEILDAAETLLLEHGSMDDVSVRAIADAVGVTPPSIYLHFDDKDDLFFDVCERRFGDFNDVLAAAADEDGDLIERFRSMGRAYIFHGVENAAQYQLLFGPKATDLVGERDLSDSAGMQAFGRLVDIIAEGMEAGVFRRQDPWLAAFSVWSTVHGAVMIVLAKNGLAGSGFELPDLDALADACCDMVLDGLAVHR